MTSLRLRRILRAMRRGDRRVIQKYTAASGTAREASSFSSSGEDTRTFGGVAHEQAVVVAPAPKTVRVARPRPQPAIEASAPESAPVPITEGVVEPVAPDPPVVAFEPAAVVEPASDKVMVAWPRPTPATEQPVAGSAPAERAPVVVEPVRVATPAPVKPRRPMIAIDLRSVPSSMEQSAARWRASE